MTTDRSAAELMTASGGTTTAARLARRRRRRLPRNRGRARPPPPSESRRSGRQRRRRAHAERPVPLPVVAARPRPRRRAPHAAAPRPLLQVQKGDRAGTRTEAADATPGARRAPTTSWSRALLPPAPRLARRRRASRGASQGANLAPPAVPREGADEEPRSRRGRPPMCAEPNAVPLDRTRRARVFGRLCLGA